MANTRSMGSLVMSSLLLAFITVSVSNFAGNRPLQNQCYMGSECPPHGCGRPERPLGLALHVDYRWELNLDNSEHNWDYVYHTPMLGCSQGNDQDQILILRCGGNCSRPVI